MNSPAARYNTGFSRRVCAALILLLVSGFQPLTASAYELPLNCGGPDYSSATEGRYFFSDRPYTPGGAGYVGGTPAGAVFGYRIGGTNDPRLYSTYRSGALAYRFDVPNGDYLVRLYLAELVVHGPTLHRQSIAIEGVEVVTNRDQFELVGLEYATVLPFVTMVTDGTLDVELSSLDFTALNAIAVESITPDAVPPAPPPSLAGFDSFQRNLLDWAPSGYPDAQVTTETDLQGYRVYRSASPGGPYTVIGPDPLFVSRFLDDDVTPGVESYYRVTAVDVFGNESVQSPELALTPLLPSASVLPVYELTISPDELRRLQLDPLSDEYVEGDFFHGGNGRTGVGIRYRGGTTRFRSKKNYKVRFAYDALWENRRKLNFNALFTDETLLREGLAYRLYADFDVLTPTNEHVYLQLNQEYLGVYHALEQIDIRFLEFRGLDLGSNIYKCSDNLEILPTLDDYKAAYEKETHPGSSYQDIIDLIELINLTPEADFARELSRVLDVDEYLRYYAAIIASTEQDFTRANYYLLNDQGSGLWRVIPWDNNVTFGFGSTHSSPLDLGSFQNPGWESSRLIGRLMNTPEFRYAHAQNLLRLAEGPFSESNVDGYVQTTHTGFEFNALRDWFKNGWESNNFFQSGPTDITDFCDARRAFIQTASYTLMPEVPGLIVVNEIMPLNQTTMADEHGEFDPWIEIWNTAYTEIGLGGMFLSDNPGLPTQWVLPDVRVPARSHVLVWTDGEPHQGPMHTSFRLDAENGGTVYLYDVQGNGNGLMDQADYMSMAADVALARIPDGGQWETTYVPTPGTRNVSGFDPPPVISSVSHQPALPEHLQPITITAQIEDESSVLAARVYYDSGQGYAWAPLTEQSPPGSNIYEGTIPGTDYQSVIFYYVWAMDDSLVTRTEPPDAPDVALDIQVLGGTPPLFVNEFLARNHSTNQDEFGEYDDWMEIYNSGDYSVNLCSMSLSDDAATPGRWELPDYALGPGEFVLVWVDDDEEQGPLHANFGLDWSGDEIFIFDIAQKGHGLIDTYAFGPQAADISMGRLPDGGSQWVFFPSPTPGYSNVPPTAVEDPASTVAPVLPLSLAPPAPNPFNPNVKIRFTLPSRGPVTLAVYDVHGRLVRMLARETLEAGLHEWFWDGRTAGGRRASSGVYGLRLQTEEGTRVRRVVLIR